MTCVAATTRSPSRPGSQRTSSRQASWPILASSSRSRNVLRRKSKRTPCLVSVTSKVNASDTSRVNRPYSGASCNNTSAPRSSFSLSIGIKPPWGQIPPSGRWRHDAAGRTLTIKEARCRWTLCVLLERGIMAGKKGRALHRGRRRRASSLRICVSVGDFPPPLMEGPYKYLHCLGREVPCPPETTERILGLGRSSYLDHRDCKLTDSILHHRCTRQQTREADKVDLSRIDLENHMDYSYCHCAPCRQLGPNKKRAVQRQAGSLTARCKCRRQRDSFVSKDRMAEYRYQKQPRLWLRTSCFPGKLEHRVHLCKTENTSCVHP